MVLKFRKDAGVDGFIFDLRTVNNTPTLSLCSSSSKEVKTKVDATPLKKPAYKVLAQANNLGRLPMTEDQEEDKED